jgi:chromosome segregation ATPase
MYLEWLDLSGTTIRYDLHPDMEPVTIGRNPGSRVYSMETSVSRNHARIWHETGTGYVVEDLGSSNGTFVNGHKTRRSPVQEGDVVRFGEVLEVHARSGHVTVADAGPTPGLRRKPQPNAAVEADDRARLVREQAARHRAAAAGVPVSSAAAASSGHPAAVMAPVSAAQAASPRASGGYSAGPRSSQQDAPPATAKPMPILAGVRPGSAGPVEPSRKLAALEAELAEALERADKAENGLRLNEQRSMRYSVELDGLSDKYIKLKEHNQTMARELERTREELAQRTGAVHDAERKANELEQRLRDSEDKATDATDRLAGLKVRLTQKDRQLEELQRQMDQLEFDYRSAQDELESLQVSLNRESGDTSRFEREKNLLREVIQEKEAIIQDLKSDLRDKDIEIRQIRMGVGMSDLEHEKRRLLEDFHQASRRVDELSDKLAQQTRLTDTLRLEVEAARVAQERKPAAIDVTELPEYRARVREVDRLRDELTAMQAELQRERARHLELTERLHAAESAVQVSTQAAAPTVSAAVVELLESLADAALASRTNATVVRRYADQLEHSGGVRADLAESVSLLSDTAIVLAEDLREQERMLAALQRDLGVHQ